MQIIPVMDISNGLVVHAVGGNRQNYKAIESNLTSSAAPFDVIDGFLGIHHFESIYIADLDALENDGEHFDLIRSICKRYSMMSFWLDCGTQLIEQYIHLNLENLRLILSSESISSLSTFISILDKHPRKDFILSLDFKEGRLLGSNELLSLDEHRLDDVIVLNLSEVGTGRGFILPTQIKTNRIYENNKLYVGGGIRNIGDVIGLSKQGIEGVLISSALHSQAITRDDLTSFSQSL